MSKPTAISLFSGIGGIDLAFSLAGFNVIAQVEIDPFCRKVLAKHAPKYWPNAVQFEDVKSVGRSNLPAADVIFGGFPCQDISQAGMQAGIKVGTRSGLWFEFSRIIDELRPRYVFLENVAAIINNGGTEVLASLASIGYDAEWYVVPVSAVGSPQNRDRWFCVACARSIRGRERRRGERSNGSARIKGTDQKERSQSPVEVNRSSETHARGICEPRMGGIVNGLSVRMDRDRWVATPDKPQYEWEVPRTTEKRVKQWEARIKALGNAVVPQVIQPFAEIIYDLLQQSL